MPNLKEPRVVVVNADHEQGEELCSLLRRLKLRATSLTSAAALTKHLQKNPSQVVLLDMDTVPVDNSFFRALKRENRDVHVLGLSSRPHHPGLEEAMGSHIYACLAKPLDPEELRYWLRSIFENLSISWGSSES